MKKLIVLTLIAYCLLLRIDENEQTISDEQKEKINEAIENIKSKLTDEEKETLKGLIEEIKTNLGEIKEIMEIPGVGYVSNDTDDPVIVASVFNYEEVGVVAGAMIGAILGNKNTYLVKRGTPANVIPGSVIFTVTALMNGNPIDISEAFTYRTRLLK